MISVIVPVYKVEEYLSRCVDSLLSQTETDFELILVDDGSPDQCGAICDRYALTDSRVKVIHKENGGLADARNAGLAAAKGEYIAFVDSDDWVEPQYLERLLAGIEGAEICECEIVRTAGENTVKEAARKEQTVYEAADALKNLISDHIFHQYVWNKLYKREVIGHILFEKGKLHEDEFWTYQVFGNARRISKIEDVLYNYYQRPGSIMNHAYNIRRLDGLEAKALRQKYLEEHYPGLAADGKKNMFYAYVYAGQMIEKDKKNKEYDQIRKTINCYRKAYRLSPDEIQDSSLYEKTWICIMNLCFWAGCRLRNFLKIGF